MKISNHHARNVYELRLERACLRAMSAVVARDVANQASAERLQQTLAVVEGAIREAEAQAGMTPMMRLATHFALGEVDVDFVWTAVAATADPRFLTHAIALFGSEARRGLPLALYCLVAGLDGADARALTLRMTASHPLLRYQLLDVADDTVNRAAAPLRASFRLAAYLAGADEIDPLVLAVGARVRVPDQTVFDEAQEIALRHIAEGLAATEPVVLVIEGSAGSGRRTAAATLAARQNREVIAIDAKRLAPTTSAVEEAAWALRRECLLRHALPLVAHIDDLAGTGPEAGGRLRALGRILDDVPAPVVLTSSRPGLELGLMRRVLRVEWPVPEVSARRTLWRRYLGEEGADRSDEELAGIALRYRLGAGGIERAAASARWIAQARGQRGRVEAHDLVAGVRNNIAESLGTLARRIEVKQRWDDLVLAPDLLDQIHALIGRIRHAHRVYEEWGFSKKAPRGLGVPVLFSGPPGTGKTMVAGIMAQELDLELLQVDLSQVVSKWVGETEKQLSQVFDAAEAGHALLLFDEADALFAKRTEVKGATDRYANLEVNYLLQRVESFGGITILTTNLDASIDPALKRRLAAHVVFWPPDEDERADLWRRLLDTGSAPVDRSLDLHQLAHAYPDMTGAHIRNAVLAAAFLAARESSEITQEHLERAAKGEYRTMGHVLR